jgi:Uma2 family endonuclease
LIFEPTIFHSLSGFFAMSSVPYRSMSEEEFYAWEAEQLTKHQYFRGQIFDLHPPEAHGMAGTSPGHNRICCNLIIALATHLRDARCQVLSMDVMVRTPSGLDTYPDVFVFCDEPVYADAAGRIITNPTLIIEVLSPSTANYDRGEKFEQYRTIPSLREYLLVAQDQPLVEQFTRGPAANWLEQRTVGLNATLQLNSVQQQLPFSEIYSRVQFTAELDANPQLRLFGEK